MNNYENYESRIKCNVDYIKMSSKSYEFGIKAMIEMREVKYES